MSLSGWHFFQTSRVLNLTAIPLGLLSKGNFLSQLSKPSSTVASMIRVMDVNYDLGHSGNTLMRAAYPNDPQLVKLLFSNGADPYNRIDGILAISQSRNNRQEYGTDPHYPSQTLELIETRFVGLQIRVPRTSYS